MVPSGLSTAIRLKSLSNSKGLDLNVCLVEKGSEVGAHILSGAVIETKALDVGFQTGTSAPLYTRRPEG